MMKVEDETEVKYLCGGELKAMDLRKWHLTAYDTKNQIKAAENSEGILHRVLRATASN